MVPNGSMCLMGVQRDPAQHACRRVTQSPRHPAMRRLVQADGKQQYDNLKDDENCV
jgi:hypothetical protein